MREEVKLEAAMAKATSCPRSSTSSRLHTSLLISISASRAERSPQPGSDQWQFCRRRKYYTRANKEEDGADEWKVDSRVQDLQVDRVQ
jgi:hypothetical protein